MLALSAETNSGKTVKGVQSYCIPNYYDSKTSPLAIAKRLSKRCNDIIYTQVCRGHKTVASAKKELSAAAEVKEITAILAVTGDKASSLDISIFDLIQSIDKRRFKVAAALVFTRKNEATRITQKAAAGATTFCTQPIFPGNSHKLAAVLQKLPPLENKYEVRIGVLIPFSAAVCRKIAKEKPDFIPDSGFIGKLAAAERKSAAAAYAATIKLARENLKVAMKIAEAVNSSKGSKLKVAGVHFYGLTNRVFGTGKGRIKVTTVELLKKVLN